ncbi:MAG: 5-formyltetrahydrofolate cyclo-ligase [Flavobacteriales bacterium]|nr:MAG: 5-formyltetrahydrofolate cyclo-ligase [Flavobacteriales bacterium]
MTKNELRQRYKRKRKSLSKNEILDSSKLIFKHFIDKFNPQKGQKIHLFLTIEKLKEIDTSIFIDYCFEHQIRVFVPKMKGNKLYAIEINENTIYETNSWEITEPISDIDSREKNYDFILTPMLYCDSKGNRVGYGKGFYDSFFSEINSGLKIGVNFFEPQETIDNVWENDVTLDYLITPNRVLSFIGSEK